MISSILAAVLGGVISSFPFVNSSVSKVIFEILSGGII